MKKLLVIGLSLLVFSTSSLAQRKTYTTTGGELIFSFANLNINGADVPSTIRFSPVFNIQTQVHHDLTDRFGILTGFNLRNVGFIYDDPVNKNTYYKVRNYTIGLPIGIKVGNMDGRFVFAGYEIELPFVYKQKTFVNDEKTDKFEEWFSPRIPTFYHSVFLGFGVAEGVQLKFKYYLNNWYNKGYTDGTGAQPYANFNANVFYFALTFQIFRGTHFDYPGKSSSSTTSTL